MRASAGRRHGALSVRMVDRLDDIPRTALDSLAQGRSFYVSPAWLRVVEGSHPGLVRYLVCEDSSAKVLGVLPVYAPNPGRYHLRDGYLAASGGAFERQEWPDALVLGSHSAYATEFLITSDPDPPRRAAVLPELLQAARTLAGERQQSVTALHLTGRGQEQLRRAGIAEADLFTTGGTCVVEVEHDSFDAYATAMGRRGNVIRREQRIFRAAGYTVTCSPLSTIVDRAAVLCTNLQRKYGDPTTLAQRRRYFHLICEFADDASHAIAIRRGDQTVGVALCFIAGDSLYVRQAGFDYDRTGSSFEYFNLVLYTPISMAIDRGLRRVEFGPGSYEAKVSRGARLERLAGFALNPLGESPMRCATFAGWESEQRRLLRPDALRALDGRTP